MNAIEILTAAMADGLPRTTQELHEVSGLTQDRIHGALSAMRRTRRVVSQPVAYVLIDSTPRKAGRPKMDPAKKSRQPSIVERAMRTQPNSVFALGSM